MKKIIFFVSLLAIASLTAILPVSAQEAISSVNLEVENPGILPTSPFYFFKEWKRGINKFFTFNPVKKAELELDEINQRAAEIKKMEEIAPQNIEAINRASSNYQKNAERLKSRLEALKETSQNPNVDKLLDKLVDRSFKHQELFDNLEKKFEARQEISEQKRTELKEKFEANRERINEIMVKVPEKFENIDAFKQRMETMIENRPEGMFKELRAAEMLDRIKEKLPENQQEKIRELKDKMIEKFENRMEKLNENERMRILSPEAMELLPGNQIRRMEILKEIEGKVSPEIRKTIENVGEKILEQKIEKREIREEEVKRIIQEVKDLIIKAEEGAKNISVIAVETRQSVEKLLERAKIHLSASEKALAENKIGEAFGQASAAVVAAKNALHQIMLPIRKSLPLIPERSVLPRPNIESNTGACIQVITPAISLDGVCKEFPTPCDVPSDWKKVERCPLYYHL
ncbi:MAG: hypothetical protein DDT19_02111 [Syntrophomonadaceae bacterium]|nr:hypothetical protein [Bacillota bacterium]